MNLLPKSFTLLPEVARGRAENAPLVALESTVITHGLPYPENIGLAQDMEDEVRKQGGIPATIGIIEGKIHVGLSADQLKSLAESENVRKISARDIGPAISQKASGGTTVAGTLVVARKAGIRVFATGGIGGVHRGVPFDVSADLPQLSCTPLVVVCAGAKAILDLPATLEYLETAGVPVIGYQTDEFPAFYSLTSGLPVSVCANSPQEVAEIAQSHWGIGQQSAVLVTVPPPENVALPHEEVERAVQQALDEVRRNEIRGQAVSPFLLARVSQLTHQASLKANLGLLRQNAQIAARIAVELSSPGTFSA